MGRRSHAAEHGSTASELRECDGASLAQPLLARGSAASGAAARPLWRGSPGTAPTRTRWRSSSVQAPAAPQLVHASRSRRRIEIRWRSWRRVHLAERRIRSEMMGDNFTFNKCKKVITSCYATKPNIGIANTCYGKPPTKHGPKALRSQGRVWFISWNYCSTL